jgi:mannosyltransferase OCH1-like enzyme
MTPATLIPKTLHYCWFGPSAMSPLGEACIQTWRRVMPEYELQRWDEARLDWRTSYVAIAYRARKFAFVADYVRLHALHEHGGVYLDTDVEVLRPFDALMDTRLFIGLQTPDSIGAGVIGAVRGHPFLRRALDQLDAEAARGRLSFQPLPELVTQLARAGGPDAPTVLPEEYFYPYNPHSRSPLRQKPLQSNISERTFSIHHWEGSWVGEMSIGMQIGLRLKHRVRSMARGLAGRFAPSQASGASGRSA